MKFSSIYRICLILFNFYIERSEEYMFLEIFDSFLYDEIISMGYSRKTEERYIVFSRLITKFFGNIEISRLDEKKVREWRVSC